MKVLLVEDDGFKKDEIEEVLRDCIRGVELTVVQSVREAVTAIQSANYDHIVLDVALPSHDNTLSGGGALPMPSGGIEVLLELAYESRSDAVTILTQYPEIEFDGKLEVLKSANETFLSGLSVDVVDVIYFEMDDESWKQQLKRAVNRNA